MAWLQAKGHRDDKVASKEEGASWRSQKEMEPFRQFLRGAPELISTVKKIETASHWCMLIGLGSSLPGASFPKPLPSALHLVLSFLVRRLTSA